MPDGRIYYTDCGWPNHVLKDFLKVIAKKYINLRDLSAPPLIYALKN
jgi:hypothetical protein